MRTQISLEDAQALVVTRAELLAGGGGERALAAAVASGDLRRLQRNRYVWASDWNDLWEESRHLLAVVAAHAEARDGSAVFSYASAAVLHGLPLYRYAPDRVHVTLAQGDRASSRSTLMRHRDRLPPADVTAVSGVPCTTLERTAFDVARVVERRTAIVVLDAALRRSAFVHGRYDEDAADQWKERMRARVSAAAGARGIRQAEELVEFADGRAEAPGESVARLHFAALGFARFGLQVPVRGPNGIVYRVDLEVKDIATFVEIDGQSKYLDEALRAGRTIDQVILQEKRREDWIRGAEQKRFIRLEDAHLASVGDVAARLRAFHIPLPRP